MSIIWISIRNLYNTKSFSQKNQKHIKLHSNHEISAFNYTIFETTKNVKARGQRYIYGHLMKIATYAVPPSELQVIHRYAVRIGREKLLEAIQQSGSRMHHDVSQYMRTS